MVEHRPAWTDLRKLDQHHQKHCTGDAGECLKDVLGTDRLLSRNDYADLTDEVYDRAYIEYVAHERGEGEWWNPPAHYRVDGRSLKVVADLPNAIPRNYRSLHHVHYRGRHDPEEVSKPAFDQLVDYIQKRLLHRHARGDVTNCKLKVTKAFAEDLRDNPSTMRAAGYLTGKVVRAQQQLARAETNR
ncbi:hypothetical protein [Ruegeria sp. HKCCD7318]|uniref:hypothetical protein n=1 Tax=Ruegeria sp. HKCCD7318 TaxID=2683014 RepID=UPI001C123B46|nr:hypothetical protein [Ruegeria sp. HKCCD7318]